MRSLSFSSVSWMEASTSSVLQCGFSCATCRPCPLKPFQEWKLTTAFKLLSKFQMSRTFGLLPCYRQKLPFSTGPPSCLRSKLNRSTFESPYLTRRHEIEPQLSELFFVVENSLPRWHHQHCMTPNESCS